MPRNTISRQKILRLSLIFFSFLIFPGFVMQGCVGIQPKAPQSAIITNGGVFKSSDNGKTWQQKARIDDLNNISNINIISFAIDPKDNMFIFAGTEAQGLYRTIDGAETWQRYSDVTGIFPVTSTVKYILIDPKNSENIYVVVLGGKDRVLKSSDRGNTWSEVYTLNNPNARITSLSADNYDNSVVYITTSEGGLFKGVNYGTDWRLVKWQSPNYDVQIITLQINPKDSRVMYLAASDTFIYKTSDKGNTWEKLLKDKTTSAGFGIIASLSIDPVNTSILYAGTNAGLIKTSDGGKTWFNVPTITPNNVPIETIAINPTNSQILYYSIGSMLYKTIDGGVHWEIFNLPTSRILKTIIVDPIDSKNVYIGSYLVVPPEKPRKPFQLLPDMQLQ